MMSKMSKMSMAFFRHLTLVRLRSARGFPSYRLFPTTDQSEKSYPASPLTMSFEVDNMRAPPKCQNVECGSNLK